MRRLDGPARAPMREGPDRVDEQLFCVIEVTSMRQNSGSS